MLITLLVACWLAGLFIGEVASTGPFWIIGATLLAGAGLFLSRRRPAWRRIGACLLAFSLGAGRIFLAQPHIDEGSLSWYNDRGQVTVRGIVSERPDILGGQQTLRVSASHLAGDGFDLDIEGDLLVKLGGYPRYQYGDELAIEGQLVTPPRFPTFDYRQLLAQRGIYSLMPRPDIQLMVHNQGDWLSTQLYRFKDRLVTVISQILPMPQSALLAGMLVGDESGIPASLEEAFRTTGTSHIVVISGWNVTILAGLVIALLVPLLGRRKSLWVALAAIAGYTLLVGFDPPIVRAAIMGGLTLLALLAGRQTLALNSLALAALLMTLIHPFALWDLGFQLSFAAASGLILFQPPLKSATYGLLGRMGLAGRLWLTRALDDLIIVTLSVQILTLPLIAYRLGQLSLITLPANLLVLPAQAPLLGLGALATLGGLIWLPFGRLLAWLAWPFLTYTIRIVEWLALVPGAMIAVPRLTAAFLILYYVAAILIAVIAGWETERRRQVWLRAKRGLPAYAGMLALVLPVILIWSAVFSLPDGRLHVYFLDVGQGDAIFIQSPTGKQILVDGGPDRPILLSAVGRRLPFWDRSLDAILATHGDGDHINGLFAALDHYRVNLALDSGLDADSELAGRWSRGVIATGAERTEAEAGLVLALSDGVYLEVLHPPANADSDWSDNDRSIVARLVYGEVSLLLTGDLEREGESALLASGRSLASTVLKVAHHGAATGTSEAFLDAVSPAVVVISVGAGNKYWHPAKATLRRLEDREIQVWRTDEAGTIELITDGEQLWMRSRRW